MFASPIPGVAPAYDGTYDLTRTDIVTPLNLAQIEYSDSEECERYEDTDRINSEKNNFYKADLLEMVKKIESID